MRKLNPFRGLENPVEVWAWGMYDFANQSFTLLINTLLFAIFFKEAVVGVNSCHADMLWGITVSSSMLIVVITSPFLGAIADARGIKKRILLATGVCCICLTGAFGLIPGGYVALAIALYIPANISYQIGENFLASFLPEVSTPRNIGRISAIGWTMGYVGALALLAVTAGAMHLFKMQSPSDWRPLFVFAAVWFAGGMIAPAVVLKETKGTDSHTPPFRAGMEAIVRTVRSAGHFRQLIRFLLSFWVYGLGVQTVIFFSAIIARDPPFSFGTTELVLFIAQLTVTAGIAAALTSRFQDRLGAKLTVMIYLIIWIVSTLGMALIARASNPPEWTFWLVGNGLGLGLGGIGTASRAMVGLFTPRHKTAEFFGLWGMVYKLAGVAGPFIFGFVKAGFQTNFVPLLVLTGFFFVGFILVLRVSEFNGLRAARRAERGVRDADAA